MTFEYKNHQFKKKECVELEMDIFVHLLDEYYLFVNMGNSRDPSFCLKKISNDKKVKITSYYVV
jgi:hypothetical protein